MGFTQRQAAGKFTRDEAAAFIVQLRGDELNVAPVAVIPAAKLSAQEQLLRHLTADQLAAELGATVGRSPSRWRAARAERAWVRRLTCSRKSFRGSQRKPA